MVGNRRLDQIHQCRDSCRHQEGSKVISVLFLRSAFTNMRTEDGTYEAIVLVGATPRKPPNPIPIVDGERLVSTAVGTYIDPSIDTERLQESKDYLGMRGEDAILIFLVDGVALRENGPR